MTQEEKAKAYDEALENARQEYNTTENVERKQWLEELFPELVESEDEKIRRALMKFIEKIPYERLENDGVSVKDALAWLEKQGEQKPDWSIKEKLMLNDIIETTERSNIFMEDYQRELVDWLKSLKQRIAP